MLDAREVQVSYIAELALLGILYGKHINIIGANKPSDEDEKVSGTRRVEMRRKLKRPILYLCLLMVLGMTTCRWQYTVQSGNLGKAQREIDSLKKALESDTRFSELIILSGADNIGKYIIFEGSIPNQTSLDHLKFITRTKISSQFNVRYSLRVEEDYQRALQEFVKKSKEDGSTLSVKELRISKIIIDYFHGGFSIEIKGPMTIEEVEKESLEKLSRSSRKDIPKVPFGFQNDRWKEFKDKYQDGDEIYHFISDEKSWRALAGKAGYVLMRKEKIIDVIVTELS